MGLFSSQNTFNLVNTMFSGHDIKENIEDLDFKNEVTSLRPVSFTYTSDESKKLHFGLVEEEVVSLFPSLVTQDKEGEVLSVKYEELSVLLLYEIKKLKKEVQSIRSIL